MTTVQQSMTMIPGLRNKTHTTVGNTAKKEIALFEPEVNINSNIRPMTVEAFSKLCANMGIIMGRNQMFKWLRDSGYLSKQKSTWNMPMQKYITQNMFRVKIDYILTHDEQVPKYSPRITIKGQMMLIDRLRKESIC